MRQLHHLAAQKSPGTDGRKQGLLVPVPVSGSSANPGIHHAAPLARTPRHRTSAALDQPPHSLDPPQILRLDRADYPAERPQ